MNFLAGFIVVNLFGILARILEHSFATIEAQLTRMGSPPHPILRPTGVPRVSGIGTRPDVSPIRVMIGGCSTIIVHLLLQAFLLGGFIVVLLILPENALPDEIPEDTWVGALFAVLIGVLVNAIYVNWLLIVQLFRRMVRPPDATCRSERRPNIHHLAATPPLSPPQVVFGGCFEIMARLIGEVFLVAALVFVIREMIRYLWG